MRSLIFEHFCGKEVCATADDVRAVFRRDVNGVNEWIISDSTDSRSPYLSVLANQNAAAVFYTPADGSESAGFQAYGDDEEGLEPDPDGVTIFYTNTPAEELEISNEIVCTREKALEVVLAFMEADAWCSCWEDLPDCVEWEEL